MDPIASYMRHGSLPDIEVEADKLKTMAIPFYLLANKMYQKSYHGTCMLRIEPSKAEHIMASIHDSDYGNHTGCRSSV